MLGLGRELGIACIGYLAVRKAILLGGTILLLTVLTGDLVAVLLLWLLLLLLAHHRAVKLLLHVGGVVVLGRLAPVLLLSPHLLLRLRHQLLVNRLLLSAQAVRLLAVLSGRTSRLASTVLSLTVDDLAADDVLRRIGVHV